MTLEVKIKWTHKPLHGDHIQFTLIAFNAARYEGCQSTSGRFTWFCQITFPVTYNDYGKEKHNMYTTQKRIYQMYNKLCKILKKRQYGVFIRSRSNSLPQKPFSLPNFISFPFLSVA